MSEAVYFDSLLEPVRGVKNTDVWTEDRNKLLAELYHIKTASQIADAINAATDSAFTRNAVISRSRRLNLCLTDEERSTRQCRKREGGPRRPRRYTRTARLRLVINNYRPHEPPAPELPFLCLTVFDLKDNMCRFPKGEESFTFCGQKVREGSSYCGFHHRLCWKPAA